MLKSVDDILSKEFKVITPKKVTRTIIILVIAFVCFVLIGLCVMSFYTYYAILGIPPYIISLSYLLANLPYYCVIVVFYFSTASITRRFYYVNNILRQLAPHDIPKNVFELCSITVKNDRHTPTIALSEIYSIYGGHMKKGNLKSPTNKSLKFQDDLKKEINKLTKKIEHREENIWAKLKRVNLIEVEEFKLSKMRNADEAIEYLTKLIDIHDTLLDCINVQNEILSFQILVMVAQIFVFEVFALFSLYRTMYNRGNESNVLALANVTWLSVYNAILFVIMYASSRCVNEGKLTGTYCHKVINKISHNVDPRIIEKVN